MSSESNFNLKGQKHRSPTEKIIIDRLEGLLNSSAPKPVCVECIFWSIAYADRRDLNTYIEILVIQRKLQWQTDHCAFCGDMRRGAKYLGGSNTNI